MAKDNPRHQREVERKHAKRKAKARTLGLSAASPQPTSRTAIVRSAARWPVLECRVSRDWNKPAELPDLTHIIVARESPAGKIVAGVFLVDLACLGVKNAYARGFESRSEYGDLVATIEERQPLQSADLDLVAKILREAIAYARGLGFKPHRDYNLASVLLDGAKPDLSPVDITVGWGGMPYFVAGPYDNPVKIISQLTRAVGPGNFHYFAAVGGDEFILPSGDSEEFDIIDIEEQDS